MREDQLPEGKFKTSTFAHNWGIVIPCESGYLWQQQTNGVMCRQVWIEGIYIPLIKPRKWIWEKDPTREKGNRTKEIIPLLKELQRANYEYRTMDVTDKIWKDIKEAMKFDFEDIEAPEGQHRNIEGLRWIKFTKFTSGWGHGSWVEQLIGMEVALIYPNCD